MNLHPLRPFWANLGLFAFCALPQSPVAPEFETHFATQLAHDIQSFISSTEPQVKFYSSLQIATPEKLAQRETWIKNQIETLVSELRAPTFTDRLSQEARDLSCIEGTDFKLVPYRGIFTASLRQHRSLSEETAKKELVQRQAEIQAHAPSLCSGSFYDEAYLEPIPQPQTVVLKGQHFFKDNEATLDPETKKHFKNQIATALGIQGPAFAGTKIHSLQVFASANTLANTKNFEPWDHLGLSQARGHYIKSLLSNWLKIWANEGKIKLKAHPDELIKTYTLGQNGDGTSGPCAYEMTPTGSILKKNIDPRIMESAKYAKIVIGNDPVESGNIPDSKNIGLRQLETYLGMKCFKVKMSCR